MSIWDNEKVMETVRGAVKKPVKELNAAEHALLEKWLREHSAEELDALLAASPSQNKPPARAPEEGESRIVTPAAESEVSTEERLATLQRLVDGLEEWALGKMDAFKRVCSMQEIEHAYAAQEVYERITRARADASKGEPR